MARKRCGGMASPPLHFFRPAFDRAHAICIGVVSPRQRLPSCYRLGSFLRICGCVRVSCGASYIRSGCLLRDARALVTAASGPPAQPVRSPWVSGFVHSVLMAIGASQWAIAEAAVSARRVRRLKKMDQAPEWSRHLWGVLLRVEVAQLRESPEEPTTDSESRIARDWGVRLHCPQLTIRV